MNIFWIDSLFNRLQMDRVYVLSKWMWSDETQIRLGISLVSGLKSILKISIADTAKFIQNSHSLVW